MIPGALRRNISSYDKGTLKKTSTVDKTSVTYQQASKDKSRHGTPTEWQALQNKIFTRWVNQKLAKRRVKIDDVTTGLKDGSNLVILLEALSDTPFDKKMEPATMRVKQIDNVNRALEFMFKVGVQMPLKPSAENIVDGNEKIILGMLWSVMLKFLKIGEEEELNAQDALLMWMQNQVNDYKGVSVTNLTTSFHDGMALCALIHHFRPKLINMDALDAKQSEQNLQTAFDAAETYFGLEQYLTPSDIAKLDDKSMSVFLAEFYYGISEERRLDIAAKRVVKVIRFTDKNDKFKEEYTAKAQQLNKQLEDLQPQLAKMAEIDNTMAGAKKRLDELTAYKTKYKGELLSAFLYLESLYNQIARRLHEAKRPEFSPTPSVKDLQTSLDGIEEKEGKLQVSLYEEFNRQIRLANTNQRHVQKFDELKKWSTEKKIYLSAKEEVKSVGAATYQLNVLADFQNEFKGVQAAFEELKKMGDGLSSEKFEDEKSVRSRESNLSTSFQDLTNLGTDKKEILDDDLAREKVAEKVTGWDRDHVRKYEKLQVFIAEKKKYLETKAEINSVSDAKLQLELLAAYESEKKLIAEGNMPPLQKLGSEIRSEKYQTKHSIWVLPTLSQVHKRDMQIEADFQQLDLLSSEKLKILTDDLQREEFREKLNRLNQEHIDKYSILDKWIKEKNAYLNVVEEIKSSADAEIHLGILVAYHKERQDTYTASVPPLKALGVQIMTSEYKSALSKYKFKTPAEVTEREETVEKAFNELDSLHAVKHKRLIDDLKREEYREKVELWNQKHIDKSLKIQSFISASSRYLKKKETVDSIADAHLNLSRLRQYFDDQKDNDIKFTDLQKLGTEIRDAKYKSDLSEYKFPQPETVTERETAVATSFKELSELASKKKAVLEDDLAREEFREKLRQWNVSHIDKHKKINEFIVASKVYLGKKEPVSSISDAQLNLARLNEYFDEKKIADVKFDTLQTLGSQIKDDEYKTELSTFKFKTPEEIDAREAAVKKDFATLDELSKKKLAILEDDLGREEFREKLRQMNLKHTDKASKLHEFILATKTYLHTRDEVSSIPQAHLNLSRFREYTDEKKINNIKFDDLKEFGAEIKSAEYKKLTTYKYPHPDEIDRRESEIADDFKEIETLANKKFDVLNDDLERELFKEKLRRWNQDHIDKHTTLTVFISQSRKYLKGKEGVTSIAEAQVNLDRIRTYFGEKADFDIKESGLRALGRQIKSAEYKTDLSTYKFQNVKEIEIRENDISIAFAELDLLSGEKDVEGDQMDWLRGQAEKLNLILGEVDDADDDDDDEDGASSNLEVKERAARRKSVKVAAALMSKGEYKAGGKLAVLKDDLAREQFKQKLRRWNKQHIDSAKGLLLWIAENRAYLEKKEPVDSISDAEKNLARLRAYETAKADVLAVQFAALKKLGAELLGAEYKTQWTQWKWETPTEVTQREEELAALFQILDKFSATKFSILDDDLHREEFREKLRLAGQSHLDSFNNIKAWAVTMRERLEKKETVNSISDANNNLASFAAALADKEDATNINVSSLKKAGAEILAAEYKGISTYKFPDPGSIKSREFGVDKEWHLLEQLATEKKVVLDADLKREILKEELRLSFADAARDFNRFALEAIQEAKEAHFGFSLTEVKQAKDTLNKQDASHLARAGTNKKEYEKFHGELTKLGVEENVYTKHTPASLNQTQDDLAASLKARQEAHAAELKRQMDNDALCLDFAHKAEALNKKLKSKKESIATSTKAIEDQLRDVETSEEENKKSDEKEQAEAAQAKVTAAGVTNNPHTIVSVADLEVGLKQYILFLGTKRDVLAKEIEHKKLRGVSAAEYAEIDRQFKKYDADSNGRLERAEFKACLYSLGEELGKRQIQAIMDQYTKKENAESILYDQFKEFMITYFGVTDTKQDILGALKEIAAGDEKAVSIVHIRPRRMQVFTEDDLGFFQKHCTKTEGRAESWDYIPFVDSVFAR